MRHIKVKALVELDQPELRAFLKQARKNAGVKRPRKGATKEVVTRVKQRSPVKQVWPRLF